VNLRARHPLGSALITVLTVLIVIASCVGIAMTYTQSISRNVRRSVTFQTAQEVGDGALELAFASWREICQANANTPLPTMYFDTTIPLPTGGAPGTNFPDVPDFTASRGPNPTTGAPYTIANFRVQAVDPQISTNANGDSTLTTDQVPPVATGRGAAHTSVFYLASADVSLPMALEGTYATVKVRRVFRKETKSPWEHAIFFMDTLEIQPTPLFTVTGPVHTNADLYTARSTVTFADQVDYGLSWTINYHPQDPRYGVVTPGAPTWPAGLPPSRGNQQNPLGMDSTTLFDAIPGNDNDDGYHEIIEQPVGTQPDPLADIRVYNQAGVRVIVDASNSVTIKRRLSNGSEVVVTAASTGSDKQIYDVFNAAVSTGSLIQDNREGAQVRLVNVDMGVISQAMSGSDLTGTGFNGIIYVADTSADPAGGTPKRGVRLLNGGVMPVGGISVATENPLYIQGDYNTGTNGGTQPLSNLGDPTQPTVSGYTRQPCAVMADSVNILSNSWTDAGSFLGLASRVASPTTVNTAILSGVVATKDDVFSGGVENFPRLQEDWTGQNFTYYGSMVELFGSKQGTGSWGQANVYAAPNRRWFFDTNFLASPPKGIPALISYNRDKWYTE
jgi:hypothetical protein